MKSTYKRIYFYFSFFLNFLVIAQLKAQNDYPKIGKPCPTFILKRISQYSKRQVSLKDFLGKPLILDFFSTGCTACFKSFPKINNLRRAFGSEVQYLLVGYDDKYIRPSYEKYRIKFNLEIPIAFDSTIFKNFKIKGVPFVIWIDGKGIVKAITSSEEVTEINIRSFLMRKTFKFIDYSFDAQQRKKLLFDSNKPFLVNGNGGVDSDFMFRSLISPWKITMRQFAPSDIYVYHRNHLPLQIIGMPLEWVYRFAYFGYGEWGKTDTVHYGNYSYNIILQLKDSSLFNYNFATGRNIYCYSQLSRLNNYQPDEMLEIMREDLKNCFGYNAVIEERKMPYIRLASSKEAKFILKARDSIFSERASFSGIKYTNGNIHLLISQIAHYLSENLAIIDETGIAGNIDITVEAIMTDFDDVKRALKEKGLYLEVASREMKVIVLRDTKNTIISTSKLKCREFL